MKELINTIEIEFERNSDTTNALGQKAYMKNKFEFYGIKATKRRELQKPFFIKEYLPKKDELEIITKSLWSKPQREFQYFAQELVFKYAKQIEVKDIKLFEFMVTHKSWWDTVDYIASKLIGEYFKIYPELKKKHVQIWLESNNIWLQRSALLFQLKYKQDTDTKLLESTINSLLGSQEFFINKAIGWILREFSKTNPEWMIEFANKTQLDKLSRKEALKIVNR